MAHDVRFTIPERKLGKSDIIFIVQRDEARLGKLLVSKGAVEWTPGHKRHTYQIDWARFDEMMRTFGRRVRASTAGG